MLVVYKARSEQLVQVVFKVRLVQPVQVAFRAM